MYLGEHHFNLDWPIVEWFTLQRVCGCLQMPEVLKNADVIGHFPQQHQLERCLRHIQGFGGKRHPSRTQGDWLHFKTNYIIKSFISCYSFKTNVISYDIFADFKNWSRCFRLGTILWPQQVPWTSWWRCPMTTAVSACWIWSWVDGQL